MSIVQESAVGRKADDKKIITSFASNPVSPGILLSIPASKPIPGEENTSPDCVLRASQQLVASGLSIIPIEASEGSKSPDTRLLPHACDPVDGKQKRSWAAFQIRRPTPEELLKWYAHGTPYGLAVLGGAVSGGQYKYGLEIIDFDHAVLADPWMKIVEQRAPGLVSRLVRIRTPRPGMHCYYRCSNYCTNQKLAFGIVKDDFGTPALDVMRRPIRKTLIETKAEGGYCLIPPSPSRCHPTGRLYQYAEGSPDLTRVPTITPEERMILLDAARSLNECKEVKQEPKPIRRGQKTTNQLSPGDDFNARGDWAEILTPHGWALESAYGEELRWCRPGKPGGNSATTNHGGNGLLHVFTSSAYPLELDRNYSKFSAYTVLNHGADYTKAARALRVQGFGSSRTVGVLLPIPFRNSPQTMIAQNTQYMNMN